MAYQLTLTLNFDVDGDNLITSDVVRSFDRAGSHLVWNNFSDSERQMLASVVHDALVPQDVIVIPAAVPVVLEDVYRMDTLIEQAFASAAAFRDAVFARAMTLKSPTARLDVYFSAVFGKFRSADIAQKFGCSRATVVKFAQSRGFHYEAGWWFTTGLED